eukprot:337706_1
MWQKRRNNANTHNVVYFDGTKPVYSLGSGDSYYIPSFIDQETRDSAFKSLINGGEINWYQTYLLSSNNNEMYPQKRLSNTQISPRCNPNNNNNNNNIPLYRYPCNNLQSMPISTYTKSISRIIECVEKQISQPINHAVVALYRNGSDHIGYHVDKMLDIKTGSQFCSISLGTKREFAFKEIDGNGEVHIMAHHGSIVVIGPETNKYFKHTVLRNGQITTPRISISVRYIDTFWNKLTDNILGQGSKYQTLNYPLKPFECHDLNHKVELVKYKYPQHKLQNICIQNQCSSYKYNINNDKVLNKNKIMEICYSRKDSHFRCILFKNVYNKSKGYEIIKYLKTKKYTKCIHIPYAMIINDKLFEYDNDGEPKKAKIGQDLFNILKKNNNNKHVMIVVVRHWLNTFLGLNNLQNCYQIVAKLLFENNTEININCNDDEKKENEKNYNYTTKIKKSDDKYFEVS